MPWTSKSVNSAPTPMWTRCIASTISRSMLRGRMFASFQILTLLGRPLGHLQLSLQRPELLQHGHRQVLGHLLHGSLGVDAVLLGERLQLRLVGDGVRGRLSSCGLQQGLDHLPAMVGVRCGTGRHLVQKVPGHHQVRVGAAYPSHPVPAHQSAGPHGASLAGYTSGAELALGLLLLETVPDRLDTLLHGLLQDLLGRFVHRPLFGLLLHLLRRELFRGDPQAFHGDYLSYSFVRHMAPSQDHDVGNPWSEPL